MHAGLPDTVPPSRNTFEESISDVRIAAAAGV